jgi:hypothetical protein
MVSHPAQSRLDQSQVMLLGDLCHLFNRLEEEVVPVALAITIPIDQEKNKKEGSGGQLIFSSIQGCMAPELNPEVLHLSEPSLGIEATTILSGLFKVVLAREKTSCLFVFERQPLDLIDSHQTKKNVDQSFHGK